MMTIPFDSDAVGNHSTVQHLQHWPNQKQSGILSLRGDYLPTPVKRGNGRKFYMAIQAKHQVKHMHVHGVSILFKDLEKLSEVSDNLKQLYKN